MHGEEWWDVQGASVQTSWAMLNAMEGGEDSGWNDPEGRAKMWAEYEARCEEGKGASGEIKGRKAGGGDIDEAFADLDAWLDDRERDPFGANMEPQEDIWEMEWAMENLGEEATMEGESCLEERSENVGAEAAQQMNSADRFVEAKRFGGEIEGMVFKKGNQGLGYYKDEEKSSNEGVESESARASERAGERASERDGSGSQ